MVGTGMAGDAATGLRGLLSLGTDGSVTDPAARQRALDAMDSTHDWWNKHLQYLPQTDAGKSYAQSLVAVPGQLGAAWDAHAPDVAKQGASTLGYGWEQFANAAPSAAALGMQR
jgi:hypothetical protein